MDEDSRVTHLGHDTIGWVLCVEDGGDGGKINQKGWIKGKKI